MSIETFIAGHRLPAAFAQVASTHYTPLAERVHAAAARRPGLFVLGVNGAQGSGKSTLAAFLAARLSEHHGLQVAELSIDDLYLTRAERARLGQDVHPLLATRGVPGTHDVALGRRTLAALAGRSGTVPLPRFDKSRDDRVARERWPGVRLPIDVVVFEGWCVGSRAEPSRRLAEPVNELERREDPDGRWRSWVNTRLREDYPALFEPLDALVHLHVPGFEAVRGWRLEQEHKLRESAGEQGDAVMDDAAVERFIAHFERITRHDLAEMPARADALLELDESHAVSASRFRGRLA